MKNHLSMLPTDAKKRLHKLCEVQPLIVHMGDVDTDVSFLLNVISWLQIDDPEFPIPHTMDDD